MCGRGHRIDIGFVEYETHWIVRLLDHIKMQVAGFLYGLKMVVLRYRDEIGNVLRLYVNKNQRDMHTLSPQAREEILSLAARLKGGSRGGAWGQRRFRQRFYEIEILRFHR